MRSRADSEIDSGRKDRIQYAMFFADHLAGDTGKNLKKLDRQFMQHWLQI